MSLLDDVSIVVTPNGYKAGTLFGVIPVPTEGAEIVTNGDFATDSDWTLDSSTSIAGGLLSQNGTAGRAFQSITFLESAIGTYLKITFTVEAISSGSFQINCYGVLSPVVTTTGTYTFTGVTSDTTNLYVNNGGGFANGSISNISVKTFLSADMDVTRETAATRVDENGLVNYAEVVSDTELVTNGDFSNGTTDWTVSAGTISVDNGRLKIDSVSGTTAEQTATAIIGKTYKVTYDFTLGTATSGAVIITGGNYPTLDAPEGTNTFYSVATSTSFRVRPRLGATGTMFVDNVSVKQVDRDNVPRIDYTGGGCPHILAEPQRTNEVTYSSDFSNAYFQKIRSTISTDQIISPDGTQNADKFIEDSALGTKLLWTQDEVVSIGDVLTWSVFVKKGERDWIVLQESNAGNFYAFFDLDNGVIGTKSGVDSSKIEDLGSGWYRCSITYTTTGTTAKGRLYLADSDNSQSYQGNGTSGLYIWGAQLELGSYATSYIPTSGSTVTRNQDTFTRDGIGSLINSTEGVLFVEMAALSNDSTRRAISLSDGTNTNRLVLRYDNASNRVQGFIQVGGATNGNINDNSYTITNFLKIAYKWKAGDFALWINGDEVGTTADATSFGAGVLTEMQFNEGDGAGDEYYGKVKQLQVYKTALTDVQLAALTS